MTEEEQIAAILQAARNGEPLPEGVYFHVSHSPTQADWDALDPNSWETCCADCNQFYAGVFAEPVEATEFICPLCDSTRTTGLSSPAGGMSLILLSEV